MTETLLVTFLLFFFNLIFLRYIDAISNFLKLIDIPKKNRSLHKKPISKIGGLVFFVNFLIIFIFDFIYLNIFDELFLTLITGVILFFLVGYLDDIFDLSASRKFLILLTIFFILINFEEKYLLNFLYFKSSDKVIYLQYFNYIFTFFCIYLLINTFNMVDGINGLSISIFFIWFVLLSINSRYVSIELIILITPSVVLLLYKNLKNILFIGNSGSYLLSGLISILTISLYNLEYLNSNVNKNLYVENILLLFLVPGLDCARLFFYRLFFLRKSFYKADNNHFHHLLINNYSLLKTNSIYLLLILIPNIFFLLFKEYVLYIIFINITIYILIINHTIKLKNE